jgi:ribosome biogenesis protein ENP2
MLRVARPTAVACHAVCRAQFISDDFKKLVVLQTDRTLEFHAGYGKHYRTRIPRFGRDMVFHEPSAGACVIV